MNALTTARRVWPIAVLPLLLLASRVALHRSATIVEYQLPRAGAFPHDPAVGPDGIVWYTDQRNSTIGRLDPATGSVTDYATPTSASGPHGIIVAPDGSVWYTGNAKGLIGRLDPATGAIKEFSVPAEADDPHTPAWLGGKLWFTAQGANRYGVLDPATGAVRTWPLRISGSRPYGLVAGPDGRLWMALLGTNMLCRIDPKDGSLREFPLPAAGARPRRLQVDPSGIVWYSDYARGQLGRLDPATGAVREFAAPGGAASGPYGIALGTDGRIWFDQAADNTIVAFDPVMERMERVAIPTPGAIVRNMSVDSTRLRVWLALSGTQRLGKIELRSGQ